MAACLHVPDLELAAKRKRLSAAGVMPVAPPVNPEEEKKRQEDREKALAEKKGTFLSVLFVSLSACWSVSRSVSLSAS